MDDLGSVPKNIEPAALNKFLLSIRSRVDALQSDMDVMGAEGSRGPQGAPGEKGQAGADGDKSWRRHFLLMGA